MARSCDAASSHVPRACGAPLSAPPPSAACVARREDAHAGKVLRGTPVGKGEPVWKHDVDGRGSSTSPRDEGEELDYLGSKHGGQLEKE